MTVFIKLPLIICPVLFAEQRCLRAALTESKLQVGSCSSGLGWKRRVVDPTEGRGGPRLDRLHLRFLLEINICAVIAARFTFQCLLRACLIWPSTLCINCSGMHPQDPSGCFPWPRCLMRISVCQDLLGMLLGSSHLCRFGDALNFHVVCGEWKVLFSCWDSKWAHETAVREVLSLCVCCLVGFMFSFPHKSATTSQSNTSLLPNPFWYMCREFVPFHHVWPQQGSQQNKSVLAQGSKPPCNPLILPSKEVVGYCLAEQLAFDK